VYKFWAFNVNVKMVFSPFQASVDTIYLAVTKFHVWNIMRNVKRTLYQHMQLANTQQKSLKSACVISYTTSALQLAISSITLGISPNVKGHLKNLTTGVPHNH
jgi:hypothetical protein